MKVTTPIRLAAVTVVLAVLAMLSIGSTARAQTGSTAPMMGASHAVMMQKMAAACVGKAANDVCSITRADGSAVPGTCETKHGSLFCIPTHHHHHHGSMGGSMAAPSPAPSPGQ